MALEELAISELEMLLMEKQNEFDELALKLKSEIGKIRFVLERKRAFSVFKNKLGLVAANELCGVENL